MFYSCRKYKIKIKFKNAWARRHLLFLNLSSVHLVPASLFNIENLIFLFYMNIVKFFVKHTEKLKKTNLHPLHSLTNILLVMQNEIFLNNWLHKILNWSVQIPHSKVVCFLFLSLSQLRDENKNCCVLGTEGRRAKLMYCTTNPYASTVNAIWFVLIKLYGHSVQQTVEMSAQSEYPVVNVLTNE